MTEEQKLMLTALVMGVSDCGGHHGKGEALDVEYVVAGRPMFVKKPEDFVPSGATTGCSKCARKIVEAVADSLPPHQEV